MPRRSESAAAEAGGAGRRPRRARSAPRSTYKEPEESDVDNSDNDSAAGAAAAGVDDASREKEEEVPMQVDDDDDDDDSDEERINPADDESESESSEFAISRMVRKKRQQRKNKGGSAAAKSTATTTTTSSSGRRSSSRSARFTGSMKEPPTDSVRDLFQGSMEDMKLGAKKKTKQQQQQQQQQSSSSRRRSTSRDNDEEESSSASENDDDDDDDDDDEKVPPPRRRVVAASKTKAAAPRRKVKSPARRHARARKSVKEESTSDEESYDDDDDDDDEADGDGEDGADKDLKIQRVLASRTETKAKWREIGRQMNSTEITNGSRWFQESNMGDGNGDDHDDNEIMEERFLIKWSECSYLHVSWETQADLLEQVDKAKTYMSTFFRKAQNGILLSQDDRKDGDYFDPGCTQIERILEVTYITGDNKNITKLPTNWEEELTTCNDDFDIILDTQMADRDRFEEGTGRQFLIKWEGLNYSDASYEFERDFILADMDYKTPLKAYYERSRKPTAAEIQHRTKQAELALREGYKLFGDKAKTDADERQQGVKTYQLGLANHVFANGGQLRDYQAEGVSWFLANYINKRSCILADEMGLGKTLQTAAFINLLATKLHRPGPFLIVVPLSTIAHWQREFIGWTGLNTIVYHGSADDRTNIRQHEFAYPQDRPDSVGSNTTYLKKCKGGKVVTKGGHNNNKRMEMGGPWMATVVVCTPEMLTADDSNELAAVKWEVLVVDEAHRLKNHNSKLAVTLRKDLFSFNHKVLLTGTPIQNDMKEFWTLLNFIDPENFDDVDGFLEQYGTIKSKERIDEMHETIRPYILRRLKEDVEKSVPPKEETLIEVELTLQQKQYYRALYEKNVGFLQKNKKKALDGPSLNNLAMQLRKCCNHLFLLNGVEIEIRNLKENQGVSEADLLARGSGKLVLLDKLLPRLKENGHRVLIFSQFKIMLDVLEDYLVAKQEKFERIDGSITGHRRQASIDRFQDPNSANPPFIMLLSTRAGGVGINLTSADTCIIFDSDWNPQNDLQAQARCHRIGQTKNVKVYRLLTRKSYEMQMFHMSSLKMGLDQAVLKGFESGASGEGAMTKEEVERLLRHGAYDIFNEEKTGSAEAESNDFVQQDIDSILARRSRTVVHENTGSGGNAAGGTFSKASFVAPKTPSGGNDTQQEDVDIEDPDFWKKMVGEAKPEAESVLKPRRRNKANYSEKFYEKKLRQMIALNPADGSDSSQSESGESDGSDDDFDEGVAERARWGGQMQHHWKKSQAAKVLESLERFGYGVLPWTEFRNELLPDCKKFTEIEVRRMVWAITLLAVCEVAKEDAAAASKRAERYAERKREMEREGDILAVAMKEGPSTEAGNATADKQKELAFAKLWNLHSNWAVEALDDAVAYSQENEPRSIDSQVDQAAQIEKVFYGSLWDSLKGRGWKEEETENGKVFKYADYKFDSPGSVLNEVVRIHPELSKMVLPLLNTLEENRLSTSQKEKEDRDRHLGLNQTNVNFEALMDFLVRYAPLQLLGESRHTKRLPVGRRVVSSCSYMYSAALLKQRALMDGTELKNILAIDGRSALPHPSWTVEHDAILINAIVKHGWVDREKACRKIVSDPDVKWGYPFELTKAAPTTTNLSDEEWRLLNGTAERASSFLEESEDLLDALKGFNRHLIIESYGLKHIVDDGAAAKWSVDEELLLKASNQGVGGAQAQEAVDLPTKKDMAKRAKLVVQRSVTVSQTGSRASTGKPSSTSSGTKKDVSDHGYAVIDQGNRCCILLAEMVRGICKGSLTKAGKQVKLLCSLAYEEAVTLKELFSHEGTEEYRQRAEEMSRIVEQIQLARRGMKVSAVPGKNIFRVMIGLEPTQPKVSTDPMFASQSYLESLSTAATQPKKDFSKKDDGALGEKAVLRAMKKAVDKSKNGVPNFFADSDDNDVGMQLTMTEVLILFAFCTDGIPLSSASEKGANTSSMSWKDSCSLVQVATKELYESAKDKAERLKAALEKMEGEGGEGPRAEAAKKVIAAEWEEALAEEAVRNTCDMTPDALAKKSILLMEKIRKFAFSNIQTSQKIAHKYENYLGPKILNWIGKELASLGGEFDVLDSAGKPLAFSTTDLLSSSPEHANTRVAAYLDKKAARQVVSQISLLSRLRALFAKNDDAAFRERLADAIGRSRKLSEGWEKRPSWWEDKEGNVDHSYLLLETLNKNGFSNVLTAEIDFGLSGDGGKEKSLKSAGLSKAAIQQRANQLVREMHAIDETSETMRLLEERRNRGAMKKQGYDRSLAECHTSKSGPAKGGIQTGLRAFFSSTNNKSGSKKVKVTVLSDDDENVLDVHGGGGKVGKRKESPVSSEEDSSPSEKKPKKLAPLFQVGPAKRKDVSPTNSTGSEKKMRTVVNQDGLIELVALPK